MTPPDPAARTTLTFAAHANGETNLHRQCIGTWDETKSDMLACIASISEDLARQGECPAKPPAQGSKEEMMDCYQFGTHDAAEKRAEEMAARVSALEEALTPSGDTKAAYIGEFKFPVTHMVENDEEELEEQSVDTYVPWTTIKQIMKAIKARAALAQESPMTDARAELVERWARRMIKEVDEQILTLGPYRRVETICAEIAVTAMERTREACVAEMDMAAHVVSQQNAPKNHEEFVFQRAAKILRKMPLPDATGEG